MMIRAINITVSVVLTLVVGAAAVLFMGACVIALLHVLVITGLTLFHLFSS